MQDPNLMKRIVTITISPAITAQGSYCGVDKNGKALVDTGSTIIAGKLISKLTVMEA